MNLSTRITFLYMILCFSGLFAQTDSLKRCVSVFKGHVYEMSTKRPLTGVIVFIPSVNKGNATDENGEFKIRALCPENYTIRLSCIGFKLLEKNVNIKKSGHVDFFMEPDTNIIESIQVTGKRNEYFTETQSIVSIEAKELDRTRGLSLGESLKLIPGINSIQTGPNISKPMIHGLHSNRILILNNGVRQEGQQWGSEHAPEIDPFIAAKFTVIKGASSIRYGSDAMAGVVLVEPKEMRIKPGIGGEVNLVGMSNGRMGSSSGMLEGAAEKKLHGLSWRVQGTYSRGGNRQTPGYYMINTGIRESDFSGTLAWKKEKYGAELYYSYFDTKIGFFPVAAQSGTIEGIKAAMQNLRPATPSYFSYEIARPYQVVSHGMFKASAFVKSERGGRFEVVFAQQQNQRSEYDYVSLSGRLNPELYLRVITHTLDVIWKHNPIRHLSGSIGFNGITQGNIREYKLLIPNFRNYGGGLFILEKWTQNRFTLEAGVRFDYRWLRVYTLDERTARVITPTHTFANVTGSIGINYHVNEHWSVKGNLGTGWKAPTVNELYAQGVESGAAAYIEGDSSLVTEQAYNFSASVNYSSNRLSFDVEVYNNYIHNYTFLKPGLAYRHDIRGSYPVFTYTQVDAVFNGIDAMLKYNFTRKLSVISKAALILAYNNTINDYLILTPANRFDHSVKYEFGKIGKLGEAYLSVSDMYVMRQSNFPASSDFAEPPAGYNLLGADLGFDIPVGKQYIRINLGVTNLLNAPYRDYLNRFRYYSDDIGRILSMRIKMSF